MISTEELQSLVGCLGSTLSPLESDALRLYLEGSSYEEMAAELGCDTKTIDNALQRVKRKILNHQRERQVLSLVSGSVQTSAVPSRTTVPSWFVIVVRSARDRLVVARLEHLDLGGDLVAGPHRRLEAPVDVQEHAARAGQVLGDDRVQQPGRDAALHDDPAEARRRAAASRRSAAGCGRR